MIIFEKEDIPVLAPYEMKILSYLKEGYSIARIAQRLHITEKSVKAVRSQLCTQFDFHRPTRADWLRAYRKCMMIRKTIPTKDVREVLQSAYNRSNGKAQEMIEQIAEELYIELRG
jgi:DNA-binding CsgD family transcriptional regulator